MMKDGKALQAGTSHYFGQNFTRAYDLTFTGRSNQREYPHSTSWGMSTRMVGAVVMAHGDEFGLQLPPKIAPIQVVVVPIFRTEDEKSKIQEALGPALHPAGGVRIKVDWRDERPGFKFNEWELKGVPLRVEIGPRDLAKGEVTLVRRLDRAKESVPLSMLKSRLPEALTEIQQAMYARALQFRTEHTVRLDSLAVMVDFFEHKIGFVITPWCGSAEDEKLVQERTGGATTRVIPKDAAKPSAPCAVCGRPAVSDVIWAKAY
jgi:prolyl-tRNA synthetase